MGPIISTLGAIGLEQIEHILPHEHVFTDVRQGFPPGFGQAEAASVIDIVAPYVRELRRCGVNVMVEATPVGVGRRADILQEVSRATDFPLVVATGIYRQPWVPMWAIEGSVGTIQSWMERELHEGIAGTSVRAGWVKLSAGDTGLTTVEEKILRAAVRAAKTCGAVIGSHTIRGDVAMRQLDLLEGEGYDADRFIWIHTQSETTRDYHWQVAKRGAWLEYDGIGGERDDWYLDRIESAIAAGYAKQVLLSQDRGWYDPAVPSGENFRSYAYIHKIFLGKLIQRGLEGYVDQIMRLNPFRAFSRSNSE